MYELSSISYNIESAMSQRNGKRRSMETDETDMLFNLLVNEAKVNENLQSEMDEDLREKIRKASPKLDGKKTTKTPARPNPKTPAKSNPKTSGKPNVKTASKTPKSSKKVEHVFVESESEKAQTELPSVVTAEESTLSQSSESESSVQSSSSTSSVYGKKMSTESDDRRREIRDNIMAAPVVESRPLLGEKLVRNPQVYAETPEERRARARDIYCNLQDLVEKHGVELTQKFTIDDDPDLMQAEYDMHANRRKKANKVNFYKKILFTGVQGLEFANETYGRNPFKLKLKDWSQHLGSEMDDYTEIMEELYEKYKNKGKGMTSPELRLIFMVTMSGVMYHLSQAVFGSSGVGDAAKNNPNLMGAIMKNVINPKKTAEPKVTGQAPDDRTLLGAVRAQKAAMKVPEAPPSGPPPETKEAREARLLREAVETERAQLAEQRASLEEMKRRQNEHYAASMARINREDAARRSERQPRNSRRSDRFSERSDNASISDFRSPLSASEKKRGRDDTRTPVIGYRLSDVNLPPRFERNGGIQNSVTELSNIFEEPPSEVSRNEVKTSPKIKTAKESSPRFDLRNVDVDLDDILNEFGSDTSNASIFAVSAKKPSPSAKKRQTTKSAKRSDYATTARTPGGSKKGIVKL
jgi:hypothetical protein